MSDQVYVTYDGQHFPVVLGRACVSVDCSVARGRVYHPETDADAKILADDYRSREQHFGLQTFRWIVTELSIANVAELIAYEAAAGRKQAA